MMGKVVATGLVLFALCVMRAAAQGAPALAPGVGGKVFDWGRPCTLVGSSSESEITGPKSAACTPCGSGATATPEPDCTFKPLRFAVGDKLSISYHSSAHHLYLGNDKCKFTTEVCRNDTAANISPATPCMYTFSNKGSFYISDKNGKNFADDGEYCKDFGASLPVTVG